METFWVLRYIVVAYSHSGVTIDSQYQPRAQVRPSSDVCVATGKELERITSRNIFLGVRCQELEAPVK